MTDKLLDPLASPPIDASHTPSRYPPVRRRPNVGGSDTDLSVRFFLSVLAQWWRLLLPVTLLLLVISISLVLYFFEPQYRAAAWLQVRGSQPYVAFPDREVEDRDSIRKFVQTQIELLRSPLILGRAMSQPEVAAMPELRRQRDPITWLATKGLQITPKGDSELLEVAYPGPDPKSAKRLVDAVVSAYFSMRADQSGSQIQQVIVLLQDEANLRAEGIRRLQAEVRQLQAQLAAKDPTLITESLHGSDVIISDNPLKTVQENLAQAQISQDVLDAQVHALEIASRQPPQVPSELVDREINQREEIQKVITDINQRRALLAQIKTKSAKADDDPRYRRTESEVAQLEQTLNHLRDASRPRVRSEMEALAGLDRQRQLESLKTQLDTQRMVVTNMMTNYESMIKDLGLSGSQTLDLRLKQRELERRQEVYDRISDRAAQLNTEMKAPQRVESIQEATIPIVPMEMLPWKSLLVAGMGSLCLPYGLCVLWERSVRRVTSVDQLRQEADVPVVGEIARLPVRSARVTAEGSQNLAYELGLFEESVDCLRTGLVLAHEQDDIRVLAVSSAVSGEGKSSVASQLAVSLARASGLPTLLIDGDMRAPDLHRIFQLDLQPGLTDVLEGTKKLPTCVNRGWSEHVHILPAGKLTKSPHKLLGGDRFKAVLEWARDQYRYVVIDTPPILAASESMVMARHADGTLICAMRDLSRESHVRMTYQRLISVGARPVGTVLSGVPSRQYARRYGAYVYTRR